MSNPLEKVVENTPKKEAYEFSVAGFKLKLNNTMIAMAIPILSTVGGAMWGAFEFYKDYTDMKVKIQKYVAPDLTEFDKRLAVIEENNAKTGDYTRDIKNDLKNDLRRLEGVVEGVERGVKVTQRDIDQDVKALRTDNERTRRELQADNERIKREVHAETERIKREVRSDNDRLKKEIDDKIKQALDNPLAGK